jgi:hypothetical protein
MSLARLQKLINSGEKLVYKGQIARILSCEHKYGTFSIDVELNGEPVVFKKMNEKAIGQWLENFSPANLEDPQDAKRVQEIMNPRLPAVNGRNHHVPEIYIENKEALTSLSKMLLQDIEKVRMDPQYVPQAKQVCNSINAIVNITKLQLQLLKGD